MGSGTARKVESRVEAREPDAVAAVEEVAAAVVVNVGVLGSGRAERLLERREGEREKVRRREPEKEGILV